jgi:hypothetical protein
MMFQDKVFVDSCSFDAQQNPEDKAAHVIHNLKKQKVIDIRFVHSKDKEDRFTNIPDWVIDEAQTYHDDAPDSLVGDDKKLLKDITTALKEKSSSSAVESDAFNLWLCHRNGIYFVTTDQVILDSSDTLMDLCSVIVCLPSNFLNRLEKIIKSEFFMFSIKGEERV